VNSKDEWGYHRRYKVSVETACDMILDLVATGIGTRQPNAVRLQTMER
jgi:hypothetical protein